MSIAAQLIVKDAQALLQDLAGIRYPAESIVAGINAGQVAIAVNRPDQKLVVEDFVLVAGTDQTLPTSFMLFIDMPRNVSGRQLPITKVPQELLDATMPAWRALPQATEIEHYCHRLSTPREIIVYPPARSGTKVKLQGSKYPVSLPTPSGRTFADVNGDIDLQDNWREALLCYAMHYAYAKNASDSGNAELSGAWLTKFNSIVGIQQAAVRAVEKG